MNKKSYGRYSFEVKNEDKVLFPDDGFTKGDLMAYYEKVAEVMLPHLKERPLSLQRFPDGIDKQGFYQKERPDYFPEWIESVTIDVKESGASQEQVVCEQTASLIYLVNQGCITFHTWLSRADRLDNPDKLIFDLDPPAGEFEIVRKTALYLQSMFKACGLTAFVMTTGSQGLHVVAPLDRSAHFDSVRQFGRDFAAYMANQRPDQLTTEVRKGSRQGRVYLDVQRNAYGQTAVAPYSLRPKPGAPVATPLDWEELQDKDLTPQRYTIDNISRRLGQKKDPWASMHRHAVSVDTAREKMRKVTGDR